MIRPTLLLLVVVSHQVSGWGLDFPFPLPHWPQNKDTMDRVKENGYPCEKHVATTEDGYLLTMFRIPHGKSNAKVHGAAARPTVIIQHGLLCSSDCWVVGPTSRSLPYVLADSGFDVWIGNNRGNTYSRSHKTLNVNDVKFWDFSMHEMGVYDLPAEIDYVLKQTGQKKTSYIGHSQGTSVFFIMASSRPEYASKLNLASALAPVVYLDSTKGMIQVLGRMSKFIENMSKLLGVHQVLEHNFFEQVYGDAICGLPLLNSACADYSYFVGGVSSRDLDYSILSEIADFCPAGTSIKDLIHFGQWTRNGGKFTKFDYENKNMQHYNTTYPPEYQLSNIVCPVALFYSCNDFIATCPETKRLIGEIPTLVEAYEIPDKEFNHMDFMWGKDVNKVLNEELLRLLKKYDA